MGLWEELRNSFKKGYDVGKGNNQKDNKRVNRVIVFEENGEIKVADLTGETICRKNLTNYRDIPEDIKNCIPKEIKKFCQETTMKYLYLVENNDGSIRWESTSEPIPIK